MHEMPDSLALSFQSGSYPQALEFVAFRRSLEHSWWHTFTDVLAVLASLRTKAASAPDVKLLLSGAPFLSIDVSAAALAKLPDPVDVTVFEDHVPTGPARTSRRVHALHYGWMPRR